MSIFAADAVMSLLRLISLIRVFIIVLAVTYYVTRWVGGYQKEKYSKGNIQIVEARQLGQNKFIYVAKIGNDYFALSSGKENFSVIGKLDPEGLSLPEDDAKENGQNSSIKEPFKDILKRVKDLKKSKE